MDPRSQNLAIIYRVSYKVMNIVCPKAKDSDSKCETTLFQTNLEKSNIAVPKMIKWSNITLPEKWILDEVAPKKPLENQKPMRISQFIDGEVEIQFSSARKTRIDLAPSKSNLEPHRSSTSSDRAYDLDHERMVLAGLRRTQEQIQRPAYRFEQTIPDIGFRRNPSQPKPTFSDVEYKYDKIS
ncbi:unnamed protein product [Prunus armeniaca]